jgi:putative peptide zinc metalloprotease protein
MGEVVWIVKDPEKRAYYQFRDPQWQLIQLFDGVRTRTDIQEEYNRQVTKKDFIRLERVLEYEEWLRGMELIEESAAERGFKLLDKFRSLRERAAEEKAEGFNIFFIRFHVVDPDRFLNRTVKYVRWLWTPPVVVATCIAAIWTVSVFINNWEPIWIGTKDLYHFWGKPLLDVAHFFFILCIIAGIHELSHAYVTKMYGGEVHDIGMALFYFTPAFYCNTSDSFMFPSRLHRLWVTIAGIYIEVIICSIATALWIASYPDSFLHQFAYKTMLLTGISTIFFNINPLIKVDGYYALSSVLDLQDLREGSFRFLGNWFQKHILRLPVEVPVMTRRRKRISVVYGLLAMTYTASIMVLVGKLFNNLYTSYFPDIATALLIVTLFYIFRKRLRKAGRVGQLFYLDKKELFMSPKSRVPLAVAGGIVLLALLLPWSHRTISAESTLQPARTARLEAPDDAVISEVLVHEGDLVQRGQPIFRLSRASIDEEPARLITAQQWFATASARGLAANDATLVFKSQRNASAVLASSRSVDVRRRDLVVRSPIQGRVLTPRTQDLVGRNIAKGGALAQIGDCRRMGAEINVTERLLEYLHPGARVTAQVRTRPMKTEVGMIARISAATLEQPRTSVGGEEPVAPHALPDRFVALASFDNPDGTLLPGAAVKVKIRSNREAYLVRVWSVLWRWLRSVVW